MRIRLTILLLLCAQSNLLLGQTNKHYTYNDGLVSNNVYYIYPDSRGFLWFGTDKGVSRFDGNSFKNFNTSNGLINDDVFVITEDNDGRIWLGTYAPGLCYIENDSVHPYELNDVLSETFPNKTVKLSLKISTDGSIYIGDNLFGLIHIDPNSKIETLGVGKRNVFDIDGQILTSAIKAKVKDKNFLFGDYIISFLKKDSLIKKYTLQLDPFRFNSAMGSHYAVQTGPDSISIVHGDMHFIKTKDTLIHSFLKYYTDCLYEDQFQRIWIGSRYNNGVYVYNNTHLEIELFHLLKEYSITHIAEDFQGGIWCATLNNGVFFLGNLKTINTAISSLTDKSIREMIKGPGQSVFLMLEKGDVWFFDGQESKLMVSFNERDSVFEKNTMFYDSINSSFYVKGHEFHFVPTSFDIKKIPLKNEVRPASLSHLVYVLPNNDIIDFRGRGIYGNINGIWRDKKIPLKDEYDKAVSSHFFNDTLWIGTLNGLSYFKDEKSGIEKIHSIQGNKVSDMDDFNGRMAISLEDKGILFLSTTGDKPILISEGFSSLKINSIDFDQKGNLFVVSGATLYKLSRQTDYTEVRRISNQQIGLSKSIKDVLCQEDHLLLATEGGLKLINYEDLNDIPIPPNSLIEISSINGKYIKSWDKRDLKFYENNIGIEFTSISYSEDKHSQFAWKINGKDARWIYTTSPSIYLNQLKPDDYEIVMKSSSLPKIWSEENTISFTIKPPFYLTWWFITITSFAFLLLIIGSINWKIEYEKKKAKHEIMLTKEKANLEMRALRAQMNPHFIFNTLTSIQYLINSSQNDRAEYYLEKFSRLLRLIVDKSDQAKVSLLDELDVLRIYVDLENLRFDDKFHFNVDIPDDLELERIRIPGMLLQPFVENAIEHGLSKKEGNGLLNVSIKKIDKQLQLTIFDDGIGREKSKDLKASRKKNHRSIGMMNVKRRLDIMSHELGEGSGRIEIEDLKNEEGEATGTRINIYIKYDYT